jgi:hypothetical protein
MPLVDSPTWRGSQLSAEGGDGDRMTLLRGTAGREREARETNARREKDERRECFVVVKLF